mmetsp:Transcript_3949/g.9309  ORF Transcript_3949/g.9309 Transcript_3949/m.9309 type:complete len:388 (+) Transcript_3949:931-2094(+)
MLHVVVLTLEKQCARVTFCEDAPCAPHVRTLVPLRRRAQRSQHHLRPPILPGVDDRGVVVTGKSRVPEVNQLHTRVVGPPVREIPVWRRFHTREAIKIKTVGGKQHILRLQVGMRQPHLPAELQTQQHLPCHYLQIGHPKTAKRIGLQTVVEGDSQRLERQTIPATAMGEILQHADTPGSAISVGPRDFAQDRRLHSRGVPVPRDIPDHLHRDGLGVRSPTPTLQAPPESTVAHQPHHTVPRGAFRVAQRHASLVRKMLDDVLGVQGSGRLGRRRGRWAARRAAARHMPLLPRRPAPGTARSLGLDHLGLLSLLGHRPLPLIRGLSHEGHRLTPGWVHTVPKARGPITTIVPHRTTNILCGASPLAVVLHLHGGQCTTWCHGDHGAP